MWPISLQSSAWKEVPFLWARLSPHLHHVQGDDLSRKPRNVREFDSCQGNVRDFTKSQGSVREKVLSGKSCLKLFTVSCMFASIQVFGTNTGII